MRNELKDFDWHIYGLSKDDFEYTLRLIKEIIADRQSQLQIQIDNIEVYDEKGNLLDNSTGIADEAISDIAYYNYIDNLYLWSFGLWRLQGIFEGILKQEFFPDKRLVGLKSKLDFIQKEEYEISSLDYKELIAWGELRNALSHFPPEQYRPIGLDDKDLEEYIELISRVVDNLIEQKKDLKIQKVNLI